MKKTIITFVCVLLAPLAFAQTNSSHNKQATTTTEAVTVTGTIIPTPEEGAATAYQPAKTLVVREDSSKPRPLCSQRAWSRCGQDGTSRSNLDQTWHSRAYILHKHGRFADG